MKFPPRTSSSVWVDPDELGDPTKPQEKLVGKKTTWMSREGSGWINGDRINGLFHLLINGGILG